MSTASGVHRSAREGFTAAAEIYVTGRPDYPEGISEWLQGPLNLGTGKTVLDLGSGTGKFLRHLGATGAEVVAIEPLSAMSRLLGAENPNVPVLDGTAEEIPLARDSLDAVVCAMSFHWFANNRALGEIHRVLKPGGSLGLVWYVRNEKVGWVAALGEIVQPYQGESPRYYSGAWRRAFPANGFGPLVEKRFPHMQVGSPDNVILENFLSISFIAALPQSERDSVAIRIREVISAAPELAGKKEVAFPYETVAYSCRKLC
jgi:SAM-dependent methyltransferase